MTGNDELPFLAANDSAVVGKPIGEYRILMIGNSITRHGTNQKYLTQYGWDHVSGMAASCEEKDYAHLLAKKIQGVMPNQKVRLIFQGAKNAEQFKQIRDLSMSPNLIVFQSGEHIGGPEMPLVEQSYTEMVTCFHQSFPNAKIIMIGIWNPRCYEEFATCVGQNYFENAKITNSIQKRVAERFEIPFADVSQYENDPANTGCGSCAPVRWHPNDNGMRCYAEAAFAAFQQLKYGTNI